MPTFLPIRPASRDQENPRGSPAPLLFIRLRPPAVDRRGRKQPQKVNFTTLTDERKRPTSGWDASLQKDGAGVFISEGLHVRLAEGHEQNGLKRPLGKHHGLLEHTPILGGERGLVH